MRSLSSSLTKITLTKIDPGKGSYRSPTSLSRRVATDSLTMSIPSLLSNPEIDDKYDELKLRIESDSSVLQSTNNNRNLPIQVALFNPHVTLRIIELLLNSWPESISQRNQFWRLPIHCLCLNKGLDEAVSVDILKILIEASPESVQRQASGGELPIHHAARSGISPKFLKILVNAYPRSVRVPGVDRMLPIHLACSSDHCRLDSVKYLLDVNPESINVNSDGWPLIHCAASSQGAQKADVMKYLLMKDPTCASKLTEDERTPLHVASLPGTNLSAVQLLFNAYPEAILETDEYGYTPLECARRKAESDVTAFLEAQLLFAEKSQDVNAMAKLDQNNWLPLHHAVKNNAPLGSIKLLVKGCALAIRVPDNNMALPLHIACEFSSVKVVQYLMDMLDERMKKHSDANGDSILHYACRGGNCDIVKYLLDKQSPYVAERNADKWLPFHLLCESGVSADSLEHTDTVYRLLMAYPETVREYM